jgi:hypothetical protein
VTYTIGWRGGHAVVSTAAESEAVLDRVAASGHGPILMHIAPDDGRESLVEMVWGDPERAMLMYADPQDGGWAVEPGIAAAIRDLGYDYGAVESDRTRLSAKTARAAVAEFISTGKQPTGVTWEQ